MMSSMEDDVGDSRTTDVDRKRDLEEALTPYQRAGIVSSDEEQQHKRAKLEANLANDHGMDLDASPPIGITASHQHELSHAKDSSPSRTPHLTSWNKGIQGGLRISFGSKVQQTTFPLSIAALQSPGDEQAHINSGGTSMDLEQEDLYDMAEPTSNRTVEEIGGALEMRAGVHYSSSDSDLEENVNEPDSDYDSVAGRPAKVPPKLLYETLEDPYRPTIVTGSNVQNDLTNRQFERESSSRTPDTNDAGHPSPLEMGKHLASGRIGLYPRDVTGVNESSKVFTHGQESFKLCEMLKQGKPISIEEITFRDFKDHFLASAQVPLRFKLRNLKTAFNTYLNLYYGHAAHLHYIPKDTISSVTGDQWAKERLAKSSSTKQANSQNEETSKTFIGGTFNNNARVTRDSKPSLATNLQTASFKSMDDTPPTFPPINARIPSFSTRPEVAMQNSQKAFSVVQSDHKSGNNGGSSTKGSLPLRNSATDETPIDPQIRELELALQKKYFPAVAGIFLPPRCLACADTGHVTLDCPALSCTFCGVHGSHSTFTCPQKQRCQKCRQRGHASNDCPEKLLASNAEIGRCDICDSLDHLETFCHLLWRSFTPKPEEIRTVSGIPVYCYTCGSAGHYGSECGLRRGTILSGGLTWSNVNLQKTSKVFSIKGKADDPITLDDSDEYVAFIRPKINNPSAQSRNGNIRFEQSSGSAHKSHPGSDLNARPQNPRRQAAPDFGSHRRLPDESARYGRERTFSPPPNYETFHDDNRYRPQMPYRQNDSRPPEMPHLQNAPVDFSFHSARSGGGGNVGGRGGRTGAGATNGLGRVRGGKNAAKELKKKKTKPKPEKFKKTKAERGGKVAR